MDCQPERRCSNLSPNDRSPAINEAESGPPSAQRPIRTGGRSEIPTQLDGPLLAIWAFDKTTIKSRFDIVTTHEGIELPVREELISVPTGRDAAIPIRSKDDPAVIEINDGDGSLVGLKAHSVNPALTLRIPFDDGILIRQRLSSSRTINVFHLHNTHGSHSPPVSSEIIFKASIPNRNSPSILG